MEKRNLRMLGLAMYAHWHDTSKLPQMIEDHLQVARFLQAVGGRYIAGLIAPAAHLGNGDDESYRSVDVKAVIANCNEIGKRVRAETSIRIGYHPEQGDIRARIWDQMVDGTDPRYFDFWPDVGHLRACGVDPLEVYKKYRARMVGTHLRDFAPAPAEASGGPAARGRMLPFGEGVIDLRALVRYLRDTKFTGSVMGEGGGGTRAMHDYMVGTLGLKL
jgi:sugar phosphate isomerase/epimerase